ncbi:MAG: sulfatase [Planctomycetes bacterium SCN 63-9]|nr:MAG: sulfatase [Planctomycetes bacterium SCN 63-9]
MIRRNPGNPAFSGAGIHRRRFLADMGMGFTGLALGAMLHGDGIARASDGIWTPPDGKPHFAPKAKSVIWLFMNGGVSHMETFDPKPELNKYAGKSITDTPYKGTQDPKKLALSRVVVVNDANGQSRLKLYPLQVGYKKYGQSGIEVSDWLPNIGNCIDDIAVVRSMWTTDNNHGAQTQFHSGRHMLDGEFPNLGAWVHYGLGTLNDNLPQYISMGNREYWNKTDGHYLGPAHDAVPVRVDPANPLDYGHPELDVTDAEQKLGFGLVDRLNRLRGVEYPDDPTLAARIKSYELAYRMQGSIPEAMDFRNEPEETHRLYGIDNPVTRDFGSRMLASRRLVERGVRFIQVQDGAGGAGVWDAHGALRANHSGNCARIDRPIAGLLQDLKRRGLLDETLVVFCTEFGRTPGTQGSDGRDHHIYGFSVWMAGGGIKGGVVHGATDDIGFHAELDRHYVTDIHATILHLLGLDSRRLEIPGRKRLEIDHGNPIREIMA